MKTKTVVAIALCVASSSYALQITDLGSLGENGSGATAISESGIVVGEVWTHNERRAFVYDPLLGMRGIDSQLTVPAGVNNSGTIVGTSGLRPAIFAPSVNTTMLIGDLLSGPAKAINNSGQVAGYFFPSRDGKGDPHGFVFDRDRGLADLGCIPNKGGCYSMATAINESGQVIGKSNQGAFIYSAGTMRPFGDASTVASSINNHGDVVGVYWNDFVYRAFIYSEGVFAEIADDYSSQYSNALDINDQGQIVGFMQLPPDRSCRSCGDYWVAHAFVYRNGTLTDLNSLIPGQGWHLQYATAINNNGQIVGKGYHHGQERAFLLTLD
jgi:uncharacterized membrane protein